MEKVILPNLGEGIEEAVVSFWYFSEDSSINKGDDLVELATDKATLTSPHLIQALLRKYYTAKVIR